MRKLVTNNPKTSVLTIITIIANAWNMVTEQAELFGIGSKTIAIGSVILLVITMAYNTLNPTPEG